MQQIDVQEQEQRFTPDPGLNDVVAALLDGSPLPAEDSIINLAVSQMRSLPRDLCIQMSPKLAERGRLDQNRAFCLPYLREATDGDAKGRDLYERSRFTAKLAAPQWVQTEIARVYSAVLGELRLREILPDGAKCLPLKKFKTFLKLGLEPRYVNEIGLDIAPTYRIGRAIIDSLKDLKRSEHVTIEEDSCGEIGIQTVYLPTSPDPIGKAILTVWERAFTLLHSANILEDYLNDLGIAVDEGSKLKTIQAVTDPWEVLDSRLLNNVRHLTALRAAGDISDQVFHSALKKPGRLLDPDFAEVVTVVNRRHLSNHERKVELAKSAACPPLIAGDQPLASRFDPFSKDEFFLALLGAVPSTVDFQHFKRAHRELFALYKRGRLSLPDALDAVREGRSAEKILDEIRQASSATQIPSTPLAAMTLPPSEERQAPPEVETYTIEGTNSAWFRKWVDGMSPLERRLIDKRLESARAGYFGDHVQLRGERRLFEFRFHVGDGKRLIFCFPGENSILLLGGTNKKGQAQLVKFLARSLDQILAEKSS